MRVPWAIPGAAPLGPTLAAAMLACSLGVSGLCVAGAVAASAGTPAKTGTRMPLAITPPVPTSGLYDRVAFTDVPGWTADDLSLAWRAFRMSCGAVIARTAQRSSAAGVGESGLREVCARAMALPTEINRAAARDFFERNFVPHRVTAAGAPGLLTAYYEPVIAGARTPSAAFPVPLHRRPADLVNLVDEADRGTRAAGLTHMRRTGVALAPFPTREEIDGGALAGQGLELFYVRDEVERFFLQVQGSGVIQLPGGQQVRVGYDSKNGHPYTSVGRYLIDSGVMGADQMSLAALGAWLRADLERGRRAIWQNKSYVFFREMPGATAPEGVLGVALTPLRSLAVDPGFHALGLPVFVDAPDLTHITGKGFQQLMVGQDVGSAIRGPQRGDIYAGSGPAAGAIAGVTKQVGRFFVLLPKLVAGNGGPR